MRSLSSQNRTNTVPSTHATAPWAISPSRHSDHDSAGASGRDSAVGRTPARSATAHGRSSRSDRSRRSRSAAATSRRRSAVRSGSCALLQGVGRGRSRCRTPPAGRRRRGWVRPPRPVWAPAATGPPGGRWRCRAGAATRASLAVAGQGGRVGEQQRLASSASRLGPEAVSGVGDETVEVGPVAGADGGGVGAQHQRPVDSGGRRALAHRLR